MELLTNSRLKAFRACQRMHRYSYVEGYRPTRVAPALAFGTTIHTALEAYWLVRGGEAFASRLPEALQALSPLDAALSTLPLEMDPFERAKARAMLAGYDVMWGEEPVEVLAVEEEFTLPLVNPRTAARSRTFLLAGKIDLILRLLDTGEIGVWEHKTSSIVPEPGGSYQQKLVLDSQVSVYLDGATAAGFEATRILHDVLAKLKIEPLKATPVEDRKYTKPTKKEPVSRLYANQREEDETIEEFEARCIETIAADPERYFAWLDAPRPEAEREEHRFDVWNLARQVREAELYGNDVRNPDACDRYGSKCAFFDVCTRTASIEDETRFRKADRQHEELSPGVHRAA